MAALEKFKARAAAPQEKPAEKADRDIKGVLIRLTKAQRVRLKQLAVAEDTSVQALGFRALSWLFESRGLDAL